MKLPAIYKSAQWRTTTSVDPELGVVGFALLLEDGSISRFRLSLHDAKILAETLVESLGCSSGCAATLPDRLDS